MAGKSKSVMGAGHPKEIKKNPEVLQNIG